MVLKKFISCLLFFIVTCWSVNSSADTLIPPVIVQEPSYTLASYSVDPNSNPLTKNFSSDIIKYSNVQNLRDVLQGQLGLQLSDLYGDGSRTTVSLRGFGDNAFGNTLVLVDGLPWFNPDEGNIDLNIIPLEQIANVEIIPSSDSVLYGDAAVGGIVNIITKKALPCVRSITAKYGNFNSRQLSSLFSDVFANHFGYSFNVQHYDSDNYRRRSASQTNNVNFLLNYVVSDFDVYVRYIRFNQRVQMPGSLTKTQVEVDPRQYDNDVSSSQENTDYWQAQIRKTLANDVEFKFLSSLTQTMEHNILAVHNLPWPFTEQRTTVNFNPQVSWLFNVGKISVKPLLGTFVQVGDYQAAEQGWNNQRGMAIYTVATFYFTPKFSLLGGIRLAQADYDLHNTAQAANDNFKNKATATTVTLNYAATKNLNLFFKRATSYRFPKVDEQINTQTFEPSPLKTQQGVAYETGLNYTQSAITTLLEVYRLALENEIITVPDDAFGWGRNENLDPTLRDGALIDAGWSVRKWLQLHGGVNYVKAKFSEGIYKGKDMPFVANLTCNLAVTLLWSEHWSFLIEDIYTGQRYPINDLENRAAMLAAVSIYNCSLSYEASRYSFAWRVNNITNKRYYNYVVANYIGANTNVTYYPASGVSTMVSVTIRF